jgi:hypothetical protein
MALFLVGALDSIVDVAQNAHGLRVQRLYGRSIVNSLHGLWSIGAVLGGLMGSAAAGLSLPYGCSPCSVPATLVGFALAGLGVATLVPAAVHTADELPGLAPEPV